MKIIAMQGNLQTTIAPAAESTGGRVLETIYCPLNGRRVSVIFEVAGDAQPTRNSVAMCPQNSYGNIFGPSLGGTACPSPCLSPTCGRD